MNKRIGKKAISLERMLLFIYKVIYAAFIMALIVFLIKLVVITTVNTADMESEAFSNRIYNSEAIMYKNPDTGRLYPGVVEWEKFESADLEKDIDYLTKTRLCAKVTLLDSSGPKGTVYINKDLYEQLEPLARKGVSGSGSGKIIDRVYKNYFVEDGIKKPGELTISIIRKYD